MRGTSAASQADTHEPVYTFHVLNEIVVKGADAGSVVQLACSSNGHHMTELVADGCIVSTPTGSTAYSLSAGGPMVHPSYPGMIFTPLCPHSLASRSLVLPESADLKIKVPHGSRNTARVTCDGKSSDEMYLGHGDFIVIRRSRYPVPCYSKTDESSDWFGSVNELLHWNAR